MSRGSVRRVLGAAPGRRRAEAGTVPRLHHCRGRSLPPAVTTTREYFAVIALPIAASVPLAPMATTNPSGAARSAATGDDEPPRGPPLGRLVFLVALVIARGRRPRSPSRDRRTSPTTSASRATCWRAAASSPTRSGASRPRRCRSPRPAFEVWLPLPTFLMAMPMAILGPTFAAAQVSSVVIGSIVCVLAWRLAADVAAARAMPVGRPERWRSAPG